MNQTLRGVGENLRWSEINVPTLVTDTASIQSIDLTTYHASPSISAGEPLYKVDR